MTTVNQKAWWGERRLAVGDVAALRVGPLWIYIRRTTREWNMARRWERFPGEPPDDWEPAVVAELPEEGHELSRFVFSRTSEQFELQPALADRSVVTSPRIPLFLAPGEETVLLIGTPLWMRIVAEGQDLTEMPIHRPSDTWFGPTSLEGELCYSARTRGVIEVDNLPFVARRAATPVRIRNLADAPLQVERLKLPVPALSLYAAGDGRLWTETVTMERSEPSEMAGLRVKSGPPPEAGKAELVCEPREALEEHAIMRVFSSLLRMTGADDD
jgi:hypothetical protein